MKGVHRHPTHNVTKKYIMSITLLPNEILGAIFECLPNVHDRIALASTCRQMNGAASYSTIPHIVYDEYDMDRVVEHRATRVCINVRINAPLYTLHHITHLTIRVPDFEISALPPKLVYLCVHTHKNLPQLPLTLKELYCGDNGMTQLPRLPSTLQTLYCHGNRLTALPFLPQNLSTLDCGVNDLTHLPTLPDTLKILNCSGNRVTRLPALPSNLCMLYCNANPLVQLPVLPPCLSTLDCSNSQLVALPILPSNLLTLHCFNNPSLPDNVGEIPDSVQTMCCDENIVTPPSLQLLFKIGHNMFYSANF